MSNEVNFRAGLVGMMKGLLVHRGTAEQFVRDGIHVEYWQGHIDEINHTINLLRSMGISESEITWDLAN